MRLSIHDLQTEEGVKALRTVSIAFQPSETNIKPYFETMTLQVVSHSTCAHKFLTGKLGTSVWLEFTIFLMLLEFGAETSMSASILFVLTRQSDRVHQILGKVVSSITVVSFTWKTQIKLNMKQIRRKINQDDIIL